MKKTLLGTTAMVAAGVVAGQAAADGIELSLGGYYNAAAGANISEDFYSGANGGDDPRWGAFRQDVEIYIDSRITLDNGITVGSRVQLEAQQSNDQIDEVWAFFQGGFGEVRFGDDDDAVEQLSYGIPTATNIFGVDSPYFSFSNAWASGLGVGTNSTYRQLSGDATKILYFSPSFGGFTFGISFAPDRRGEDCYFGFTSGTSCSAAPGGTTYANNPGQVSEVVSAAVNFEHDFNGFYIVAGGGGALGEVERPGSGNTNRDDDIWTARGHLHMGVGNWYFGGALAYTKNQYGSGNGTQNGGNVFTYGLGITYNFDAWTVGAAWSGGQYGEFYGNGGDDASLNVYRVEGRYDLGPGISLDASTGYDDWDGGSGDDYDAWTIMSGFHIGF
jgi:outer membrane protein OmpU